MKYEFWIFFILAFVLLFVFFNIAKASEIIGQQNDYSTLSNRATSWSNQMYVYKLNTIDRAIFATMQYDEPLIIRTIIDTDFTYCYYEFRDIDNINITAFGENTVNCSGLGTGISRTFIDLGGGRYRWDLTITSENAVYDYIYEKRNILAGFKMGNFNQGNFKIAGTTASTYGQIGNWGTWQSFEGDIDETIYTGWFEIESAFTLPSLDSIEFQTPRDLDTQTDFLYWVLKYYIENQKAGSILIRYATTSAAVNEYIEGSTFQDWQLVQPQFTSSSVAISKTKNLFDVTTTTTWFAKGFLYDNQHKKIAETDIILFYISEEFIFKPPSGLPSLFKIDCSQYDDVPFFGSSTLAALRCYAKQTIYEIIDFLIMPFDFSLDFIEGAYTSLTTVFPFNILFSFNEISQNVLKTENLNEFNDLTYNFPAVGEITFYTSSTVEQIYGSEAMDLVLDLQKWSVWAIVGWFAFKKVKSAFH